MDKFNDSPKVNLVVIENSFQLAWNSVILTCSNFSPLYFKNLSILSMNPCPFVTLQSINLPSLDRWQVYQRLQELDIPCQCHLYQPIKIQVSSPTQLIQVWSVTRQITDSPAKLGKLLEKCWQLTAD